MSFQYYNRHQRPRQDREDRDDVDDRFNTSYNDQGEVLDDGRKDMRNSGYAQWMLTFCGFFVMAVVIAVVVGWFQERTGTQPQTLSGFLMFSFVFSLIGTVLLNYGMNKLVSSRASGGSPGVFLFL